MKVAGRKVICGKLEGHGVPISGSIGFSTASDQAGDVKFRHILVRPLNGDI
ncbi:MAG: hypothetical protein HOM11_04365 [Methylococcales bacterium]|nr:hypothetical protein [Methylococcales bacterium]MBT7445315.1 hypothetical protein [Methylococcales bacterium]